MITDRPPNLIRHFEGNCKIPRRALCDLITQDKFANVNLNLTLIDDRGSCCLTPNNSCFQSRQKYVPCKTSYIKSCNECSCVPKILKCHPKYCKIKIRRNVSNTKGTPCYDICIPPNVPRNKCTDKGVRNDNCCIKKYSERNCINQCTDEHKKLNIEIGREFEEPKCYHSMLLCKQKGKLCYECNLKNHYSGQDNCCKCLSKEHEIHCKGTSFIKQSNNQHVQQEKCQACCFADAQSFEDSVISKSCELLDEHDCCPTGHKEIVCHTDCQCEFKVANICDPCKKPNDHNLKGCDKVSNAVNKNSCLGSIIECVDTKTSEPGIGRGEIKLEYCSCCSKIKKTISTEKSEKCIVTDDKCIEYVNQLEKWGECSVNVLNEIKDILLEQTSNQCKNQLIAKQLIDFTNEKSNKLLCLVRSLKNEDYLQQLENWSNKCTKVLRESIEKMQKNKCECAFGKKAKSKTKLFKSSKSRISV